MDEQGRIHASLRPRQDDKTRMVNLFFHKIEPFFAKYLSVSSIPRMACPICFETFPDMYTIPCGSTVDHRICFVCEQEWRKKMTVRNGKRKLTCPECRQEETSRTVESLERELATLYVTPRPAESAQEMVTHAFSTLVSLAPVSRAYVANRILATIPTTSVAPPRKVFCASGRDCLTRSRVNSRSKTHLKCRTCRVVACCATCRFCTGCVPLPVPSS
jgi:hypothetical protein